MLLRAFEGNPKERLSAVKYQNPVQIGISAHFCSSAAIKTIIHDDTEVQS